MLFNVMLMAVEISGWYKFNAVCTALDIGLFKSLVLFFQYYFDKNWRIWRWQYSAVLVAVVVLVGFDVLDAVAFDLLVPEAVDVLDAVDLDFVAIEANVLEVVVPDAVAFDEEPTTQPKNNVIPGQIDVFDKQQLRQKFFELNSTPQ